MEATGDSHGTWPPYVIMVVYTSAEVIILYRGLKFGYIT
jgi:hypothetical protein